VSKKNKDHFSSNGVDVTIHFTWPIKSPLVEMTQSCTTGSEITLVQHKRGIAWAAFVMPRVKAHRAYAAKSRARGVTSGGRGTQCPGRQITGGRRKVPPMLQVLSSIHYLYYQKTSGSKMGAPNLFLAPGAISCNLGTPLSRTSILKITKLKKITSMTSCDKMHATTKRLSIFGKNMANKPALAFQPVISLAYRVLLAFFDVLGPLPTYVLQSVEVLRRKMEMVKHFRFYRIARTLMWGRSCRTMSLFTK